MKKEEKKREEKISHFEREKKLFWKILDGKSALRISYFG